MIEAIGCVQHDCDKCKAAEKQEPVATVQCINGLTIGYLEVRLAVGTKLYNTPFAAQRPWVDLTDKEIFDMWLNEMPAPARVFYPRLCRAIEAKLKEKNT